MSELCVCRACGPPWREIRPKPTEPGPALAWGSYMALCPTCGNKRCPGAVDHTRECTGSNEPGQPGSAYPVLVTSEALMFAERAGIPWPDERPYEETLGPDELED